MHAVPVFATAAYFKSKKATLVVAFLMSAIGVVSGNPAYMLMDFIAIGAALYICNIVAQTKGKQIRKTNSVSKSQRRQGNNRSNEKHNYLSMTTVIDVTKNDVDPILFDSFDEARIYARDYAKNTGKSAKLRRNGSTWIVERT